ncbi:(2Fe-2S) ferredoxin domain-containing protein [Aerosakkonemataceae cyanobacterium BLCC-F154]|uniref:(2Fe-2S) ferredoxin domain-containing protein n=1 Tax=Floridaenema fluviatile BLCC-F154 TaxID=3153640 RepID=A0ABV4YKF0_9CYAN
MDMCNFQPQSSFFLEGRFLGFATKSSGKIKSLQMAVENNVLQIKLPKEARVKLKQVLVPGDRIEVSGERKQKRFTDLPKLTAYQVNKVSECAGKDCQNDCLPTVDILEAAPKSKKIKILMCQKSGCMKKGGKKLSQELEAALSDRGWQNQVAIEYTGCLKSCSSTPNVVLMPGKIRCSKMSPAQIVDLLADKFSLTMYSYQ